MVGGRGLVGGGHGDERWLIDDGVVGGVGWQKWRGGEERGEEGRRGEGGRGEERRGVKRRGCGRY